MKKIFKLFLIFLKIGTFTFGGGYAMIPLIENECVQKRKWISEEDMTTMVTVAESTPGPLAINSATFIGYKVGGFFGALLATFGVVLPSFIIIFVISLFFNQFLEIKAVAAAFQGIKCSVAVLILITAFKMIKNSGKNFISIFLTILSFCVATCVDIFSVNFSSIWLIAFGGILFLIIYTIKEKMDKKEKSKSLLSKVGECNKESIDVNKNENNDKKTLNNTTKKENSICNIDEKENIK